MAYVVRRNFARRTFVRRETFIRSTYIVPSYVSTMYVRRTLLRCLSSYVVRKYFGTYVIRRRTSSSRYEVRSFYVLSYVIGTYDYVRANVLSYVRLRQ